MSDFKILTRYISTQKAGKISGEMFLNIFFIFISFLIYDKDKNFVHPKMDSVPYCSFNSCKVCYAFECKNAYNMENIKEA